MSTQISIPTRRKLIDIPEDVFQVLTVKAAAMGTNLKKYIEDLIIKDSEEMEDAVLYRHLVATRPEGKIPLSKEEKDDFEHWLNVNSK